MNDSADENRHAGPRRGHTKTAALATLAISMCLVIAGPVSVSSSAPKEMPTTTTQAPGGGGGGARGERRQGEREPRDGRDFRPPTTQERDEAIEFFRQHMKFRMRVFDAIPDGRPVKNRMMQMMMERYRRLQRARMDDAAMFDLMLQQMELQDEALDILTQQRRNAEPENTDRLQAALREKVRQIVDLSLQERQKRIDNLEKQLAVQKARLEQDLANPDGLVDQHILQMRTDADDVSRIRSQLNLRGGGLGGGFGGGGPARRSPPAPTTTPTTDRADQPQSEPSRDR